jgi:hypothetical protein
MIQTQYAKNIGALFDNTLTMEQQISAICKSAFFQIRNVGQIKKYLSVESSEILIHAFITNKLDYCNSLFYCLPGYLIQRLQYVQNSVARPLTGSRKYDHITPILKYLHWLPVRQRIVFKILTLTFKLHDVNSPEYLKDMLQLYNFPAQPPLILKEIAFCSTFCSQI